MDTEAMTFYNHIVNVRTMAINLTNGEPWHGAIDKARVFDSLDASRREYMQLQEENAKLRELVEDMWACISHIGEYDAFYYDMAKDGCGISCTVNGEHCCADKLCNRMRELGIE